MAEFNVIKVGKVEINVPKELVRFVTTIGAPLMEAGELGRDYLRLLRINTVFKTLRRAQELAEKCGIKARPLPPKFLVPYLEKCSLEDEESELVDLWAKLLVSAFDDFSDRHTVYAHILSQIGPNEAKTLKHMWERESSRGYNKLETLLDVYSSGSYYGTPKADEDRAGFLMMVGAETGPSDNIQDHLQEQNMHSLFVLERQNLVKIKTARQVNDDGRCRFVVHAVLTGLGFDFVQCCEKGVSKKQQSTDEA